MQRNKRVALAIVLSLLMLLVGCKADQVQPQNAVKDSISESDTEKVELYVAAFEGAYGSDFWEDIKKGFEETYKDKGYTLRIVSNAKIEDVVTPQIRSGKGPDVMYLGTDRPSGFTQKLIASGSLLNLNDVLEREVPGEKIKVKDKILDGFLDTTATMPYADGDTFLLPLFYSVNGLFYNAALFNEDGAGGKYKLPVTWEDFLALGEQAAARGQKLFLYPKAGYLDSMLIAEVSASAGNEVLGKWLTYEDVYGEGSFQAVFENLAALKPYFAGDIYDAAKPIDNEARLLTNEVLFVPNGSWMPKELQKYPKADGFAYGFMAYPAFTADGERYFYGMLEQMYALRTGDAKREEASKALLAYMYSDQAVLAALEKGNAFVPVKNVFDLAREAGIGEETIELLNVYQQDGKVVTGSFVAANAADVNWKQIYCFSMDSIMQGEAGCDAQWWIERMKENAAKMKAGIQKQKERTSSRIGKAGF